MRKTVSPSKVCGAVAAPSSKSYAQRALVAALLSEGETLLRNFEPCGDTLAALSAVESLGAKVRRTGEKEYLIRGGLSCSFTAVDAGESGLLARMLVAVAALCSSPVTVTGRGSLLERPFGTVSAPLFELGARAVASDGFLPVTVEGPLAGGSAEVNGSAGSQFITGLLMSLPLAPRDTVLRVGNPKSTPYIDMTIDVLRKFGIEARHDSYREFFVRGRQEYLPCAYDIEGDWSGASYILVAGAVAGGVTVSGLDPLSLQADRAVIDALSSSGAEIATGRDGITVRRPQGTLKAFDFDATNCPDLFPALAALAANCNGVTTIKGAERLVHKESDRAAAIAEQFGRMGIGVDISRRDIMSISGGKIGGAEVSGCGDHRMVMAEAVLALNACGETVIDGAEAVDKSYPRFWKDIERITAK